MALVLIESVPNMRLDFYSFEKENFKLLVNENLVVDVVDGLSSPKLPA